MSLTTILQAYPKTSVILIGLLVSLLSILVTKWVTDQNRMKELKERQKEHQAKLKEHKGNPEKMMEVQKEMMSGSMEMMKHSLKPTLFTLIPLLLIFAFIRNAYAATELAKSWIWYYLVSAIVGSIVWKKVFKVY